MPRRTDRTIGIASLVGLALILGVACGPRGDKAAEQTAPGKAPALPARGGDDRRAPGDDDVGPGNVREHRRALSRAHPGRRPVRPGAQRRHRDQSRRPVDRPRARPGAPGEGAARSAARHPRPDQGQHRHGRPDGDDGRIAGPARLQAGQGRRRRRPPAGGRRGHPRQDEPQRMGQLPVEPVDERLERAGRADAQSLRPRPQSVGLELGLGRGGVGESGRGGRRDGDRRIDRLAGLLLRHRRAQADGRSGQPVGHRAHRPLPGHGRADGPDGGRCGDPARRDDRAGPGRRGDHGRRRPGLQGLPRVPRGGRPAGGPDRRPAAAGLQLRQGARSRPGRRGRGPEEGGGGDRRSDRAAGCRRRRGRGVRGPPLRVQGRPREPISRPGRGPPFARWTSSSPGTRRTPIGRCRSSARRSWSRPPRRDR